MDMVCLMVATVSAGSTKRVDNTLCLINKTNLWNSTVVCPDPTASLTRTPISTKTSSVVSLASPMASPLTTPTCTLMSPVSHPSPTPSSVPPVLPEPPSQVSPLLEPVSVFTELDNF